MTETCPNLVAVFDDRLEAERAVRDLEDAGFKGDQVGFAIRGSEAVAGGMITDAVGTKDGRGAVTGAATGAVVGGLLGAAGSLLIPGVGPVLAGGILAATLGGAAAGTAVGGILGAMEGLGVSAEEAQRLQQSFNEGKAIITVRGGPRNDVAHDILQRHGGYDIQCRPVPPVETHGVFHKP